MKGLERRLGLFSVVTISVSSMIGSGIFVLPGIGFGLTGPSIYLAFILSAICILPAAISKAELATAMPTSGGTYVYLERTFGPLAGMIIGLGLFFSILLKASFSLVGIGAYFTILSSLPLTPTILSFLVVIGFLNIFGVGKVSSFLTFILFVTLISLCLVAGFSIPHWSSQNLTPFMTGGWSGLASATGLVFVSFAGVTKVAAIAEEVKNPSQNLPRGILISLLIVTVLYSSISFILAGVFPAEELVGNLRPLYKLAQYVGGGLAGSLMAVVATLTMINTSNAGILAGSRFPFAMSRDALLPKFLGSLHGKFLTPVNSIIVSVSIVAFIIITMDVAKIAKLASAFMIMIYMLENTAVILLREVGAQWYKPKYKSPWYPGLQIIGILASLVLLFSMGSLSLVAIAVIGVPGTILFFVYARKRTNKVGLIGIRSKRSDLIDPLKDLNTEFQAQKDAQVIVSLFGKERSPEMLVEIGAAMANGENLEVVRLLEIPEQTSAHDIDEPSEMKSLRRRMRAMGVEKEFPITFDSIVSHDLPKAVLELSQLMHCKWMFVEWRGNARGRVTPYDPIGWLKSHLHCHLATFRDAGVRYIREIMALISDDKNDELVIDTANYLSYIYKAKITLYKFTISSESKDIKEKELNVLCENTLKGSAIKVLSGKNKVQVIRDETTNYDLLILGSSDHSVSKIFGASFDDKMIPRANCSVLAVHASSFSD
jgi:amino acid transporter